MHLGSDHAGLDLKAHLTAWLTEHGYEPVDHGPFVYDALDDYPVFCLRAAEAVAAGGRAGQPGRRDRRLRQRRADGRQQGEGHPLRAGLVRGDRRLAREHNDANVVAVGGRMHTVDEMTRFVEVFLATPFSGEERHVRRIGHAGDYETTGELPRCRPSALGGTAAMPEGHTLHRLADELDRRVRGRRVRVSSPQGRFADRRRCSTAQVLLGAESAGKHLFVEFEHDRFVHVHLGLIGKFDVHRTSTEVPLPVGQVRCGWYRRRRPYAYADLRGAILCDLVGPARDDEVLGRLGPDPLRPDADPDCAWARIRRSQPADRRPADGPGGPRRGRQRLPRRGAVPAPDPPAAPGQHPAASASGARCGTTWSS